MRITAPTRTPVTAVRAVTLAAVSAAAAAAIALGGAAPALAATSTDAAAAAAGTSDTTDTSGTSSVPGQTVPGQTLPGHLSVSGSPARAGGTVTFSGTCAIVSGAETPTLGSVTSSAFSSVAMDRTAPDAFSGTATISAHATPGAHTVTANCSGATVSSSVVVAGGGHVTPSGGGTGHHGGSSVEHGAATGSADSATTATTGTTAGTTAGDPSDAVVDQPTDDSSTLPLVLGGLALTAVAGGGAYALGRSRTAARRQEADRRAQEAQPTQPFAQAPMGPHQDGSDPRGPMIRR